MKVSKNLIREIAKHNKIETKKYCYWISYESDEHGIIYRVPVERMIYGIAQCEPERYEFDYDVIKGC